MHFVLCSGILFCGWSILMHKLFIWLLCKYLCSTDLHFLCCGIHFFIFWCHFMYFELHSRSIFNARSILMHKLLGGLLFEFVFSVELHELYGWLLFDGYWCINGVYFNM